MKTGIAKILSAQFKPSSNTISIQHSFTGSNANVTLTDAMGRIMSNENIQLQKNEFIVDAKNIRDGIYFLTIQSEGHSASEKVVVVW